ncbi:MAG: hypothetical protein Q8903_03495, partial [Bacteroidota bacterium]|nr:hypothetical protein [Bacteroidota bacterium]
NKILKEKIDQLNNDIESLSTPDGTNKEEKITQILDYWYLIGESTYKKYIPSTDKNTVKKIIKAIPNNFAVNYQLLADVKYTVMQVVPKKSFNVVITSKPLENKDMLFDFTLPVEVKLKQRFTFGLGARIPFEKELSAFSYLKLKANFCYLGADVYQPKANKALYTYTYKIESADLHYFYLYKANEVAKLKNYALNLQAYTPILLSAYKLIFNAGLTFVYNSVSFDYSMTIDDYMVNKGVNTLIGTKTVSKNTKENSVTVSPSFLLEYNVIKPINVYTEGIISLKGGIDIMVGLEAALDF